MKKESEDTNRFKVNIIGLSQVVPPSSINMAKEIYTSHATLIASMCKEISVTYKELFKIETTKMLEEMQKNDHAEHVSAVVATLKTLGSSGPTAFFSKDFVSRVLIGSGRDYNKQQEEARRLEEAEKQAELQKQADRKRKRSPSPARPRP